MSNSRTKNVAALEQQHLVEISDRSFVAINSSKQQEGKSSVKIANNLPMVIIAGPCQLESREHAFEMADAISTITKSLNIPLIFKTSFDKANRTSLEGKRGIGMEASLQIFADIRAKFGCPILTDIHEASQASVLAEVVDVMQIPAFLCRQTDLLIAAAKASSKTGVTINVKKGQFLAPWDMKNVVDKLEKSGSKKILLTERGVTFGYNTLVNDMRALPIMRQTGYPIVFDATHSVQQPGGMGGQSGGERIYIEPLACAAVAVGVAAVFIETHQDPDQAPSDGSSMLPLVNLKQLLCKLQKIDSLIKSFS
mgnify:CR=1 FL=1